MLKKRPDFDFNLLVKNVINYNLFGGGKPVTFMTFWLPGRKMAKCHMNMTYMTFWVKFWPRSEKFLGVLP